MNIKKLDEIDVVFIDEPWTDEDRKQFSAFLQKRKMKKAAPSVTVRKRSTSSRKKTV
jgi:hypothetical protein